MGRVLSGTAVSAERSVTRSFGPDWIWHPTAEFFLPSQFGLAFGELGVGRPCCAAQADRDLSETPPRHGRWSTTGGPSAGAWGVWAKLRGLEFPLGTGAVDALRWTLTVAVNSPCAKKGAHTPHAHTRRERAVHTRTTVLAARHVRCHEHVCGLWRCGLVSACE